MNIPPTPHPEINGLLEVLVTKVKDLLGNELVGMYPIGSLASGDFDPKSSDIGFAAVTNDHLQENHIAALDRMHAVVWSSGVKWAAKLEGSYLPKTLIRRHDEEGPACPTINEGEFFVEKHGSDWIIHRHILREAGVILYGPGPKTLIDPVSPDDIRRAIKGILMEWWFPMLINRQWLLEQGSEYHAFAVLTTCRALHGLEYGTVVSKPLAAAWACNELGGQWGPLIEKCLASRHGSRPGFLDQTLAFIQCIADRAIMTQGDHL